MRDVHTIRLRGPWQLEPLVRYVDAGAGQFRATTDHLPPPTKAKMPADWSAHFGHDFQGQVRHTRRFHTPAGLEDLEQVWLAIATCQSHATIRLNNIPIGEARFRGPSPPASSPPFRQEITHILQKFNLLEVTITHPQLDATGRPTDDIHQLHTGGLTGEVRLEIGFPD